MEGEETCVVRLGGVRVVEGREVKVAGPGSEMRGEVALSAEGVRMVGAGREASGEMVGAGKEVALSAEGVRMAGAGREVRGEEVAPSAEGVGTGMEVVMSFTEGVRVVGAGRGEEAEGVGAGREVRGEVTSFAEGIAGREVVILSAEGVRMVGVGREVGVTLSAEGVVVGAGREVRGDEVTLFGMKGAVVLVVRKEEVGLAVAGPGRAVEAGLGREVWLERVLTAMVGVEDQECLHDGWNGVA